MWICDSCGWRNDPVNRRYAMSPTKCEHCKTPRGKRRNVSWIERSLLIESQGPYHGRGEIPKRRAPRVQTRADGTAWG